MICCRINDFRVAGCHALQWPRAVAITRGVMMFWFL